MSDFSLSHVALVMRNETDVLNVIRTAIAQFGADIVAELATISSIDAAERARSSVVFSIMSPRCPFAKNVAVTPVLIRAILRNASQKELEAIIRSHGIGLASQKSLRLFAASQFVREIDENVTREQLLAVVGISYKVSAMTLALLDQNAQVFTLDTHMVKGFCRIAGVEEMRGITDSAYVALETWILGIVRELNVSPFLAQWAMWNLWKGDSHESHLAIFGL